MHSQAAALRFYGLSMMSDGTHSRMVRLANSLRQRLARVEDVAEDRVHILNHYATPLGSNRRYNHMVVAALTVRITHAVGKVGEGLQSLRVSVKDKQKDLGLLTVQQRGQSLVSHTHSLVVRTRHT